MKTLADHGPRGNPFLTRWEEISSGRARDPAILWPDGSPARTFGEISTAANLWAGRFAGARIVTLRLENCVEWPEVLLGAWAAGCVAIPAEASKPRHPRDWAAGDLEVCSQDGRVLHRKNENGEGILQAELPPETTLVKLTSGTTGEPRGIAFTGGQLLADADKVAVAMGIGEADTNYGLLPFGHSYGFTNLLGALIARGTRLVVARDPFPRAVAAGIAQSGASVWPTVPTLVRACAPVFGRDCGLRLVISAGAPLPAGDALGFFRAAGLKVHGFYGASECGGICYDASPDPRVPEGWVGTAMPGIRIDGHTVEGGLSIEVSGESVALGYVPDPGGEGLFNGRFAPSDLLIRRDSGYLVLGRRDGTLNVGGRKVRPERVESALRASGAAVDAVVFSLPAGPGGAEQIAAAIVTPLTKADIRQTCAGWLADWEIPRLWFLMDALPVTARGKTDRSGILRAAREGRLRKWRGHP